MTVTYINSKEEFIAAFGQPQGQHLITVHPKFFWLPVTCKVTGEEIWFERGFQVVESWDEDNHFATTRYQTTHYSSKGYMLAKLKDEV